MTSVRTAFRPASRRAAAVTHAPGRQGLLQFALAAIRRNAGTLLLPGAATPVLGGELVVYPSFDDATKWLKGTGWTVTGGNGVATAAALNANLFPLPSLFTQVGKTYLATVTIVSVTGTVRLNVWDDVSAVVANKDITSAGTYTLIFTATTARCSAYLSAGTAGLNAVASEISLKELQAYTYGNPPLRNYLDSAGTDILDSVTQVDQPVGLALDSMGVLGGELFGVTLNFADAAWTKTAAVTSSGANTFTTNGFGGCHAYVTAQGAKTYAVRVVGTTTVSTTFRNAAGSSGSFAVSAGAFDTGANSQILLENGSLYIQLASAGTITITSISVKEITGNHATQPTTASKPILRRGVVNQLLWSGDLTNAAWLKSGVTVTSGQADSSGGFSASRLQAAGGAYRFMYESVVWAAGQPATLAIRVKSYSGASQAFRLAYGSAGGLYSPVFTADGNWQIFTVSFTSSSTDVCAVVSDVSGAGASAFDLVLERVGLFTGTVTASQILAAGGIPLTTTAAASSARGSYWWQFDGSNDSFSTGITTGNEGWVCAGVTFGGAAANNETVFSSGAGSATQKGVWLLRNGTSSALRMGVGNGTALAMTTVSWIPLLNVPRVVEGGWDASNVYVGVDGTTASTTRTGDGTAPATALVGAFLGGILPLQGPMSAKVYCPVLPSAADRALIRRFVASLQGQQL